MYIIQFHFKKYFICTFKLLLLFDNFIHKKGNMKVWEEAVGNTDFRGRMSRMGEENGVKVTVVHYKNVIFFKNRNTC